MKSRVAVIGSGFGLYGLLPAFQRIPECSVVGIAGSQTDRLVAYCHQNAIPCFSDWREMIARQRPEALAIAVVPTHQPGIILHALERDIAVLAEKPLAVTLGQATELLARARAGHLAHMVDFIFPEIPHWKKAKQLLAEGAVGTVVQVTASWSFLSYDLRKKLVTWKTDPRQGGGALAFFFSHVFYNLEFFMGTIQSLYCSLNSSPQSPNQGETQVNLLVRFANGCSGNFLLNCAAFNGNHHVLSFYGEKGTLVLENSTPAVSQGWALTRYNEKAEAEAVSVVQLEGDPTMDERVGLVQSIGRRFIAWCQGENPARPNFEDGCRVQHLIECSRLSSQQSRVVVVGPNTLASLDDQEALRI
jgi:predicted dehydrogenase